MNIKDFTGEDEATQFIKDLTETDHTVDFTRTTDGVIRVFWVKNKMFTTYDNKEFTDEVWTTEDGRMIICQDLEPEHARNIVRMIIRNSKRDAAGLAHLTELFENAMASLSDLTDTVEADDEPRVLH